MVAAVTIQPPAPKRLSSIATVGEEKRFPTGVVGLDKCLAEADDAPEGMPCGTSMLISGMPGSGKSTLTTVMAAMNLGEGSDVLIFHGEERAERVKKRWDRLKLTGDPLLYPLRAVEDAMDTIREIQAVTPRLIVIVDSVQSLTLGGKRRPEHQSEAAEMICGLVTSNGGIVVLVNHVDKTGTSHAGAGDLPHNVDIHLHVTVNAKKGERALEVRKNRCGRAGFQVPVHIGISSISVGTPAPLSGGSMMSVARTGLEKCRDRAIELLQQGRFLTGYDYHEMHEILPGCSGGLWRAGLEMGARTLERDGHEMIEEKQKGRKGFRMANPENVPEQKPAEQVAEKPADPSDLLELS